MVGSAAQVLGDLSPQKSRVALESVVFVEEARREEDLGSVLADIIAHLGQDVSIRNSCYCSVVFSVLVPWCVFGQSTSQVSQSGIGLRWH